MWCKRVYVLFFLFFENICNCQDFEDVTLATTAAVPEDTTVIAENYVVEGTNSLENIISNYIFEGPTKAFNFEDTITEEIATIKIALFQNSLKDQSIEDHTDSDYRNSTETYVNSISTTTDFFTFENASITEIPMTTEAHFEDTLEEVTETTTIWENNFEEPTTLRGDEERLSERVLKIMEHYKQPDPEGIPGVEIPDPLPVPDVKHSVTFFDTLYLSNSEVHGFSKLHLLYLNADINNLEVHANMTVDHLQTLGSYRLSSFLMPRRGSYSVNITGLKITPSASVGVQVDGKLKTKDINMDLTFMSNETSIAVKFENLGNVIQDFIDSAGNTIFEEMKPHLLSQTYAQAREGIDQQLGEITEDLEFPNTITPLDMVLVDASGKIKELKLDPYKLDDYINNDSPFISIRLCHSWITGLSTFHRLGDVILRLENNTLTASVDIGTQKLEGTTRWVVSAGGMLSLEGNASFSVDYIHLKIEIAQSLDVREKPVLRDIGMDIGNIQARCDGAGTLDYILELVVNIMPNLLRYQILASLEKLYLKPILQDKLMSLNVEEAIKGTLPRLDEIAKLGFKLSFLRSNVDRYDDDEFFNF